MLKNLKYYLEYLIVKALFLLFRNLSIQKASYIGGWLARIIGPHLAVSKIAKSNINEHLPDKNPDQVVVIIKQMWENLGRVFAEFPHIYAMRSEDFKNIITVKGLEYLQEAVKTKQQVIIFSGHIGNWEIGPRFLIENNLATAVIYRHINNSFINKIICAERARHDITIIAKGLKAGKLIFKAFTQKRILTLLVHQKMNDGISVPFFNRNAMTAPAIAKLTLKSNAIIIPVQIVRSDCAEFIINIQPALNYSKSDDIHQDIYHIMLNINRILEIWIKDHPGQWFWLHKRWPNN